MEQETKPTRKRARKSAESASPTQHKEQKAGGLAVVVVILIGVMIIAAIFFAAQNKKTRGLENEVTSLKDKIEGKLSDITTALDEQKEEQAKVDEKIDAKTKLPKVYKSSVAGFTINYPVTYIPEKTEVKLDKVHVETFTLIKETDKTKIMLPAWINIEVYENPEDKDLSAWITENAETQYSTNFKKGMSDVNEDETLKSEIKKIGDNEFFTYTWSGMLTGDEYFIRKDKYIIRISAVSEGGPGNESVHQEIIPIIESFRF